MGAWGIGPFQNDSALDWRNDLEHCAPHERGGLIRRTFMAVVEQGSSYLDSDFAVEAIAAAAILASQLPGGPTTASLGADFITADGGFDVPTDLPPLALRALDRVVAENSEWRSLWEEGSRFEELVGVLAPIRSVLERAGD
ncbi:DUF4259 domain-containing protein [Dactylosporangium sp. CA-152071]|uniref:DUF4259 domain-containing protein n=1 Tax=Dactylosporangium sp. CA-152071 TaxID=3239933 RepID=UPI003D8E07FD